MCGGTPIAACPTLDTVGLSPRVRGNPTQSIPAPGHIRSIPACAGEPSDSRLCPTAGKVYPRVCGGTRSVVVGWKPINGLSPRVRGNLRQSSGDSPPVGSIPACAGEPQLGQFYMWCYSVYPRVCGGTKFAELLVNIVRGSIPACAGEPCPTTLTNRCEKVYPRVCGGTCGRVGRQQRGPGLSPRVRGNPGAVGPTGAQGRSIPACAGEPSAPPNPPMVSRVYPRVCGGTRVGLLNHLVSPGLSPRVRGNLVGVKPAQLPARSIPACAGEPRTRLEDRLRKRVYPRVCGGTCPSSSPAVEKTGLSPRVRGNPPAPPVLKRRPRSIPACAGEPP